jgi:glutamine amidotransferase
MQMLFDTAEEFGSHRGLGIIPGRVIGIPNVGVDGTPHKIPHIGWSEFMPAHNGLESWRGTVMQGLNPGDCGYFVHSFRCVPTDDSVLVANTFYNGQSIAAVVQQGSVVGCQFHPEKSGNVGLLILKNFVQA